MSQPAYLAWTANGGRRRGDIDVGGRDHGTRDGWKTLCGRDVAGSDSAQPWDATSVTACFTCVRIATRAASAPRAAQCIVHLCDEPCPTCQSYIAAGL